MVAVLFVGQMAIAQQKGDKSAVVALGVNTTSVLGYDGITSVGVNTGVEIGGFVADRFRIGANVVYSLTHAGETAHSIEVGPNFSYYVRICDHLYYTPTLSFSIGYINLYRLDELGFGVGLKLAAFEFKPKSNIGLSFAPLAINYVLLSDGDGALHTLNFELSMTPTLGVNFYF